MQLSQIIFKIPIIKRTILKDTEFVEIDLLTMVILKFLYKHTKNALENFLKQNQHQISL